MTDHTRRALDIAPFVLNTDEEQSLVQEALRLYGLPADERSSDEEDAILSILRTASYCVITSGASYDIFQKALSETETRLAARIAAEEATLIALLQKDRNDHLTHCNQGDYEGSCKYGWEPHDCPAAPDVVPDVVVSDEMVETACRTFVNECDDTFEGIWPRYEGDDGKVEEVSGYLRLVSDDHQDDIRHAMRRALCAALGVEQ